MASGDTRSLGNNSCAHVPFTKRGRHMVLLGHLGAFAPLALSLKQGWKKFTRQRATSCSLAKAAAAGRPSSRPWPTKRLTTASFVGSIRA